MKRIKVLKNGVVTNQAELPPAEADAWLAREKALGSFGKPARWVHEELVDKDQRRLADDVREKTDPLSGKKFKEYHFPVEFTVVEEDITAEVELRKADEADRVAAKNSLKKLKKADLVDVASCAEAIMKIVKYLRADQ